MTVDLGSIEIKARFLLLEEKNVSRERIKEAVSTSLNFSRMDLSEEDLIYLVKKLEASFQTTMSLGSTLVDASHKPWLSEQREHIKWDYWNRYKQLLVQRGFGHYVVGQMDIVTNEILDLLQNPNDEGSWQRKGLVVGHVQSGKTANYTGLVCKALDAGYRVIIILAGLLNSLRTQTQGRLDSGIIGLDSALILENIPLCEKAIGVGKFSSHYESKKYPVSITSANADFNRQNATLRQEKLDQYKSPVVFVIKKNVSILKNLIGWLKNNNPNLNDHPMLLIDDEADHASINTKKPDLDPASTNEQIRTLLALFPKKVYLGYTATPFANIFINPDSAIDMTMNDLFPENFIKTLDAPSNYFGGTRVFVEDELDAVRIVDDYKDILPLKHKIHEIPEVRWNSLEESIRVFILIRAIRILREQGSEHNSMLVNVSRFTGVQTALKILIHNYVAQLKDAISGNHALGEDALDDEDMLSLYETWEKEFEKYEYSWGDIQEVLNQAIARVDVIEVNGSKSAEKQIDYSERNDPLGRNVIAVGGLSLSRGITLEGLTTTYFLRNSIMYDTLMQMGRWFGYRPGYEDLCRIYMTEQAQAWYEHITLATDELRDEFRRMGDLNKTPKDFGLCVRSHPDSLIVTARNKMRSARSVYREIDLAGRLIETSRLFTKTEVVNHNLQAMSTLLKRVKECGLDSDLGGSGKLFWTGVHYEHIIEYIESFKNHPESAVTDSIAVKNYIEMLASDEKRTKWNVLFVNIQNHAEPVKINVLPALQEIGPGIRNKTTRCPSGIMLGQRKVGAGGIEKYDLEPGQVRETPLLMLHLLDCRLGNNIPLFPNGVAAYGISFPGEKLDGRIKKMAKYQVTTTWWREKYGSDFEDDADMKGEYE